MRENPQDRICRVSSSLGVSRRFRRFFFSRQTSALAFSHGLHLIDRPGVSRSIGRVRSGERAVTSVETGATPQAASAARERRAAGSLPMSSPRGEGSMVPSPGGAAPPPSPSRGEGRKPRTAIRSFPLAPWGRGQASPGDARVRGTHLLMGEAQGVGTASSPHPAAERRHPLPQGERVTNPGPTTSRGATGLETGATRRRVLKPPLTR